MSFNPELPLLIVYFLWSLILTILFFKFYYYYSNITKNVKKDSILKILDEVLEKEKGNKKLIDEIIKKCDKLEESDKLHIQKVGLLRFNPFKDTGGDQSFILALLDAKDTGVIISSLHTRTGTRWYAKRIVKGKGLEHDLSEEEEKTLKEAKGF